MKHYLFTCFLLCLFAQKGRVQIDSITNTMRYEAYMNVVKEHHPLAKQAQNQITLGEAYLTTSKGVFDPTLFGKINQKYTKGDQHYSIINAGLKIPTWYGISFNGGYDLTNGTQLNPENTLPDEGLWYAGVNVSLGKGLIIDQRRAEYGKAQLFLKSSIQHQKTMLNELYLNASLAYWEWFKSYNKMQVYQQAVDNAYERFTNVKASAEFGIKPFIDTLEAAIQLQRRMFNYLDAELAYQNSTELLAIYVWKDGLIPLEIDSTLTPPLSSEIVSAPLDPSLVLKLDDILTNHPELVNTVYKIDELKLERQLNRENLKPELNLKYNALLYNEGGGIIDNYSPNNYTWGADLTFPLFLRKERGALKMTKIKLENMEADLAFKTEQLSYKIALTMNAWETTYKQITLWQQTTTHYLTLLESENTLFQIGESSLFMVNTREKSYINAYLTLIERIAENKKAEIKTRYALGTINTFI